MIGSSAAVGAGRCLWYNSALEQSAALADNIGEREFGENRAERGCRLIGDAG